jgi:hypothetical protein
MPQSRNLNRHPCKGLPLDARLFLCVESKIFAERGKTISVFNEALQTEEYVSNREIATDGAL